MAAFQAANSVDGNCNGSPPKAEIGSVDVSYRQRECARRCGSDSSWAVKALLMRTRKGCLVWGQPASPPKGSAGSGAFFTSDFASEACGGGAPLPAAALLCAASC